MSRVTNLLLTCFENTEYEDGELIAFPPALAALKAWCENDELHYPLGWPRKSVDAVSGGTKHLECDLWAWGANCLNLEDFLEVVRAAQWEYPEYVQVFVKGQDDDRFVVYNLTAESKWIVWGEHENEENP